jgi:hypothetical protein
MPVLSIVYVLKVFCVIHERNVSLHDFKSHVISPNRTEFNEQFELEFVCEN